MLPLFGSREPLEVSLSLWLLFLLPSFHLLAMAARRHHFLAYFLCAAYAHPLLVLTAVSPSGYALPTMEMSGDTVNFLRVGVHLFFSLVLALYLLATSGKLVVMGSFSWGGLSLTGMMVVAWSHQIHGAAWARLALTAIVLLNLFVLTPSLARTRGQLEELVRSLVILALWWGALSAFAIVEFGNFPDWSSRLGRPLNPSVLAFVANIALVASFAFRLSGWVRALLLVLVVATGSRLDGALGLVFAGFCYFTDPKLRPRTAPMAAGLLCLILGLFASSDYDDARGLRLYQRKSFTSGRLLMWEIAVEEIAQAPWLGRGERAYLVRTEGPIRSDVQRVHNMFLEMSMSYGIPVGLLSFSVFLALATSVWRSRFRRSDGTDSTMRAAAGILGLVAGHTLFSTAYWTNLGDATMVLSIAFLVFVARGQFLEACQMQEDAAQEHVLSSAPAGPSLSPLPQVEGSGS